MASRSLNQIVKELIAYAVSLPHVRTALCNPSVTMLERGDIEYPAALFNYLGARKEGSLLVMRFTSWVLDLMLKEADNELEVWSDTTRTACDILAYLDASEDYTLQSSGEVKALPGGQADFVAGVTFEFTLAMRFPFGPCAESEGTGTDDFNEDFNEDFADNGPAAGDDFNEDFNDDYN